MNLILLNMIIILLMMLISVAFFTIMERKLLGIFHFRLGPSKVGILGLFQPFSDAMKLFSKNMNFLLKINETNFLISPLMIFFMFLFIINSFPIKMENNNIFMNFMMLIFIITLSSILIFCSSFFSFSKYSFISSKRIISQLLSYEMGFMLLFIFILMMTKKFNIEMNIYYFQNFKMYKMVNLLFMFILILMETGRIPFDFIESESELVSGFNTEYSSSFFSLFFIFEYGMMLFFSILISSFFFFFFFFIILIYLFIILRASFPRFRYDQMMIYTWKYFYLNLFWIILLMKIF